MTNEINWDSSLNSNSENEAEVISDDCFVPETLTQDLEMDYNQELITLGAFNKRKKQNLSESDSDKPKDDPNNQSTSKKTKKNCNQ